MSNLARAFTEHVSRSVKEIDASLLLLRRAMLAQGDGFKLAEYTGSSYFKNDLLLQIASVDRDGFVTGSNLGAPAQSMNLNDREHIRVHRERPGEDVLFISTPVVGRISGRWSIQFTRKILDANGDYDGVLVASVNPEFVSDYYATFDIDGGAIKLVGHDGIVRARGSAAGGDYLGKTMKGLAAVRAAATRSGCFTSVSNLDGVEKLLCAQQVPGVAQDVVVSMPLEAIDADVKGMLAQLALLALLMTLCCFPLMGAAVVRRYKLSRAVRELETARGEAASMARDLRCALANISDGIMLINSNGDVLVSNDQAFAHLGLDPRTSGKAVNNAQILADLKIRTNPEMPALPSGDGPSSCGELADLASSLALRDAPLLLALCAGPDGKVLQLRTHRLDDGGYVRTIADVTQTYNDTRMVARARDDAQAAMRARSSFLARMSHEIRTPLHSALGFTQLLAHEKLSADAATIVQNIQLSTSHLIAIVDDVLDFSTIEAGHLRMNVGAVDLPALIGRLEAIAKPLLAGRDVSLDISISPGTPHRTRTDERRLLQILVNLLTNAIKFTDQGSVRLCVSQVVGAHSDSRLRFEVTDTGCGLPPDFAQSLFEPFSRAEGVSHKPGAGLGLAIVKELVTLLGGQIKAENTARQGAKFTLEIPAVKDHGYALTAQQGTPVSKLNVLVADDTRSSLLLIRMLLERRGHRVVTVSDGQAAVEASAREAFDLVLLDIQMPLLNGFEAAAIIRRQYAATPGRRPLVSALTAQVMSGDQTQARAAGMDHFLRKPFETHELDALLRRAAENAASPASLSA